MTKTIQDLRREFHEEILTLTRTQTEMKMGLESPVTQLEDIKGSFTSRRNQIEDRTSRLKEKVEDRHQIRKDYENKLNTRKEHTRSVGQHEKVKPLYYRYK